MGLYIVRSQLSVRFYRVLRLTYIVQMEVDAYGKKYLDYASRHRGQQFFLGCTNLAKPQTKVLCYNITPLILRVNRASNVARSRCIQLRFTLRHGTATMAPPGPQVGRTSARALHSKSLLYIENLGSLRGPLQHYIDYTRTLHTMLLHPLCYIQTL